MMKRILAICALAGLLAACTTAPVPERAAAGEAHTYTLTAIQEHSPETRTVIADGTEVLWQPADEVKLFCDGVSGKFTSTNTEPAGIASFMGTLPVVIGFNEGFSSDTPLWGLYPYREDATADSESVTTTLPDAQTGKAGSFARDMYPTLGRSQSLSMGFWGICGGVRFSLTQGGIKSVTFEGRDGETLAGRIRVGFGDGVPVVREVSDPRTSITLSAPAGETFQTGQWYYIVALPGTLEKGFRLTFRKGSKTAEVTSEHAVTIKRSVFGSLAEVDKDLEFKIPGIGNPDDPISFADPKVKAKLVAAFDGNGDGELSFNEAENVTSLDGVFKGQTDYTSFDEFRFFSGIEEVPTTMCRSWTSLRSIIFPESVKTIGAYAFHGCSSLQEIIMPESVRQLDRYAFYGCSSLESVTLPEGLQSIGNWAFYGCGLRSVTLPTTIESLGSSLFCNCAQLRSVNLPETLNSLNSSIFQGCTALSDITLPQSITRISAAAFQGCISLSEIPLPETLEVIAASAFMNCSGLKGISIPGGVKSIDGRAFENCTGLTSILIPAAVTSLGEGAFRGCTKLNSIRVLPTQPPTAGGQMFDNTGNCLIYVPGATSDLYANAYGWKDYLSRLKSDDGSFLYYTSSDYSRDGEVVTLQSASVGRGVNFVLLGDGYVDRDMEPGGKYEQRMRSAMEALFAYEPYTSLRNRFNVYTVKVVSANAQYSTELSNRRFTYDSGGSINFRSDVAISYARKAPNATGQPVKVAVLCNSASSVGRSYCIRWSDGRAACIVYDPNTNVLVHELCGHGFGSLSDEYTEGKGTFTDTATLDQRWEAYQWGANTDWRNDPATIRWARLLADSRYSTEGLGIFEGAAQYDRGIYRPTNNSMMRHNNCPFNAPSREQIYKNTMKWSVGSSWTYDYETFVALDAAGRAQAAGRLRAPLAPGAEAALDRQHAETHIPPVLIDDDVIEVGFPVTGPPIPHFVRK